MASRAPIMADPLLALGLQIGIIHESSIRVGRRILFLLRQQISRNVFRVFWSESQVRHDGHILHLQFMPIIRTPAMLQIELVGKSLLGVVLGPNVLLFIRTIGSRTLPRIVNPAHQVVVVRLLADARQVRRESSAHGLAALANGVASKASAALE